VKKKGPAVVSRFSTDDYFKNKGSVCRNREYVNEDGTFCILQFDRVDDRDTHDFLELGAASVAEKATLKRMEDQNKKSEVTTPLAPAVAQSFSSESRDDDTELEDVTEGAGGLHSMICIGGRVDDGNNWFLIQNDLPVVEASQSYLAHHLAAPGGNLVFLRGKLLEGITLPLIDQGLCLESSECDDVPERDDEADEEDTADSDLEE
jgi:hypothetical protein